MKPYDKINTVFKRDMQNRGKTLLLDEYSDPAFEYLRSLPWEWTEKVDGTNIRIQIADGRVTFAGKSENAQIPAHLVTRLREMFDPQTERLNDMFPDGGCLYGEGYGAKIQKVGGKYSDTQEFVLFDVKVGDWWLERHGIEDVAAKLGLAVVPIIGIGTIDEMVDHVSTGFDSMWGSFPAEGIVARPKVELHNRSNARIITKLKTRDFPTA